MNVPYRKVLVRRLIGSEASLNKPSSMAFDRHMQLLWICDMDNSRILRYEMKTGFITELTNSCCNDAVLKTPLAVALDQKHMPIITDVGHNAVFRYDNVWKNALHSESISVNFPGSISCCINGNIYIADFNNDRIVQIDHSGTASVIEEIKCSQPYGLYAHQNELYVADTGNKRILRYNTNTGKQDVLLNNMVAPISVSLNENKDIFFSENRRLFCLTHKKQKLELLVDTKGWKEYPFARLAHIGAVVPISKDCVLFTDTIQNCVYEVTIIDFLHN